MRELSRLCLWVKFHETPNARTQRTPPDPISLSIDFRMNIVEQSKILRTASSGRHGVTQVRAGRPSSWKYFGYTESCQQLADDRELWSAGSGFQLNIIILVKIYQPSDDRRIKGENLSDDILSVFKASLVLFLRLIIIHFYFITLLANVKIYDRYCFLSLRSPSPAYLSRTQVSLEPHLPKKKSAEEDDYNNVPWKNNV